MKMLYSRLVNCIMIQKAFAVLERLHCSKACMPTGFADHVACIREKRSHPWVHACKDKHTLVCTSAYACG